MSKRKVINKGSRSITSFFGPPVAKKQAGTSSKEPSEQCDTLNDLPEPVVVEIPDPVNADFHLPTIEEIKKDTMSGN